MVVGLAHRGLNYGTIGVSQLVTCRFRVLLTNSCEEFPASHVCSHDPALMMSPVQGEVPRPEKLKRHSAKSI